MKPQLSPRRTAYDLRKERIKDMEGLGRWALHMSDVDELALFKRFPELDPKVNTDQQLCDKAWLKFIASSASEPYRVRTKI